MPETRNDEFVPVRLKHKRFTRTTSDRENCIPPDEHRFYRHADARLISTASQGPRAEDVVDEMLAILSDRKAWIEKKQSEEAQAAISRMYREGL